MRRDSSFIAHFRELRMVSSRSDYGRNPRLIRVYSECIMSALIERDIIERENDHLVHRKASGNACRIPILWAAPQIEMPRYREAFPELAVEGGFPSEIL